MITRSLDTFQGESWELAIQMSETHQGRNCDPLTYGLLTAYLARTTGQQVSDASVMISRTYETSSSRYQLSSAALLFSGDIDGTAAIINHHQPSPLFRKVPNFVEAALSQGDSVYSYRDGSDEIVYTTESNDDFEWPAESQTRKTILPLEQAASVVVTPGRITAPRGFSPNLSIEEMQKIQNDLPKLP